MCVKFQTENCAVSEQKLFLGMIIDIYQSVINLERYKH